MFAPFAIRNFRFQWTADLMTSWAFEMETLILGWYILVQTDSVLALTVFASLQWVGTLIAPAFGLAGDRIGHRKVLGLMRTTYAFLAAIVVVLSLNSTLSPTIVLVIAALAGLVRPSDGGVRNVLISATVPHDRMMSAISLSRITSESARAAGAVMGAGMVALLGLTAAYLIVFTLYVVSIVLTLRITELRASHAAHAHPSPWRDLVDGAKAVWHAPAQIAVLALAFLVNLTVFPFSLGLLPYVAREVYGGNEIDLAYLAASVGIGAIVASLGVSRLAKTMRPARAMIMFAIAWHVLVIAFGHNRSIQGGYVLLVMIGMCSSLCVLPMALLLLRGAPPGLRGRIMGMRTQAVYGLPIGLLVAGPLIDRAGFSSAATIYGVTGLMLIAVILMRWWPHLWSLTAAGNR